MTRDLLDPLVEILQPSRELNNLSREGILDIIHKHCEMEIQVIGFRQYYPALVEWYRAILDPLVERKVWDWVTRGLHYHALTIRLSEPVPEIVRSNAWNITRRYVPDME